MFRSALQSLPWLVRNPYLCSSDGRSSGSYPRGFIDLLILREATMLPHHYRSLGSNNVIEENKDECREARARMKLDR